jgi:hypothetical protein
MGDYVLMVVGRRQNVGKLRLEAARREIEERFLHFADRHLRRSEGEKEKASVCFGRNDTG